MLNSKRGLLLCLTAAAFVFYTLSRSDRAAVLGRTRPRPPSFDWSKAPQRYPVSSYRPLPTGHPAQLPRIQHVFAAETPKEREVRLHRRAAVKNSFEHAWEGYKHFAWGDDEVIPVGGGSRTVFGGWAGTLVDSLDTLWIMGLRGEFRAAVQKVAHIDFSEAAFDTINLFETNIRFLGGLLGAFDLSGEKILLQKAVELGDMLYKAFDTPNRMPITLWDWRDAKDGKHQIALGHVALAEVGTMSMEFSRLSQLTGDPKYYDAVQRITEKLKPQQNSTALPGMWPVYVDPLDGVFDRGHEFTASGSADSHYEYLPKEFMLLGGGQQEYMDMYVDFIETAKEHIFFRVRNPQGLRIQIAGKARVSGEDPPVNDYQGQHLGCFAGGLVALGARLRDSQEDLNIARELTDGCVWAYSSMPSGIMPETFHVVPCGTDCLWDEAIWHAEVEDQLHGLGIGKVVAERERLPPGFSAISDRRYLLRPEAIESVFVLYRITGDKALLEQGWQMFEAIERATKTEIAHTEVGDVTVELPPQENKMESFWTAETLKYFYLLFSEPELINLDEFVLNTEAHPFRYR